MSNQDFEVIVIGAGHAGIEAALASARMGRRTACITLRFDRIGHLPCNCSIGGPAKGHMAREVDALGGEMGYVTDRAVTHIRKVGTSKGPTVQTLRAHVCKHLYPKLMRQSLEKQPNLTLLEFAVETVLTSKGHVTGVRLEDGSEIQSPAVVITTGTFLNGLCHEGKNQVKAARFGDKTTSGLSAFLQSEGVPLRRFKTGTTPRIALKTIDRSKCLELESEPDAGAFSYLDRQLFPVQPLISCWQTWTNEQTHDLIRERLHESAMYSGQIEGIGPRYCPSIEDKIVKFADKLRHPIFLEQETWEGDEVYVQGVSTSLPAATQIALLRTIPGLENVEMIRAGYAVEYDMADPLHLTTRLMSKAIDGLFLAGQINGTSGYEEAAGQGIVAGINAARYAVGETPVDFPRAQSFIGVMVDDLTTKGVDDPYRMLTARAEHRLYLRSDNADQRLTPLSIEIGLASSERVQRFEEKMSAIESGIESLTAVPISGIHDSILESEGETGMDRQSNLFELLRRPRVNLDCAERIGVKVGAEVQLPSDPEIRYQIYLRGLFAGYLERQTKMVYEDVKLDSIKISSDFDYLSIKSLSYESREKLINRLPESVGQASRIPGVRMSDIYLLIGVLQESKRGFRT